MDKFLLSALLGPAITGVLSLFKRRYTEALASFGAGAIILPVPYLLRRLPPPPWVIVGSTVFGVGTMAYLIYLDRRRAKLKKEQSRN